MQVQSNMSAIKKISLSQEVSANNMANISTDGFKASKVDRLTISPEARTATINGEQIKKCPPQNQRKTSYK